MKRATYLLSVVSCLFLSSSCGEEKVTGFSSADKEFFNVDSPFQRGERQVGEPCDNRRDCNSLDCREGICTQPCSFVACPLDTLCTRAYELFGTECTSDEACDALESCADGSCTCGRNGSCYFAVEPHCVQLCGAAACSSPSSVCSEDLTGVDVCFPSGD